MKLPQTHTIFRPAPSRERSSWTHMFWPKRSTSWATNSTIAPPGWASRWKESLVYCRVENQLGAEHYCAHHTLMACRDDFPPLSNATGKTASSWSTRMDFGD